MKKQRGRLCLLTVITIVLNLTGCSGQDAAEEETTGTPVQVQTVALDTISTDTTVS